MRGHTNNVSSALFHPKEELIISNSEDEAFGFGTSAKGWLSSLIGRSTIGFGSPAHPTKNLLAAGHDSGMMIFKLHRTPCLCNKG